MRHAGAFGVVVAAGVTAIAATSCAPPPSVRSVVGEAPRYEVHAVQFGTLASFPKRSLVAGASAADSLDIALMIWVLRGGGRTILVDAGFAREKFIRQWKPVGYVKPSEAIAALGIRPDDVTDIVISHVHWDHADGADLFPRARIWLQRDEYDHHVTDSGTVKNRGIDADVAQMLHGLRAAGRVSLVAGDAQEIIPGVTVYTGGKHTFASQYVGVQTRIGTVVIASDNAYMYENLERGVAITQTLDATANLAAQARMRMIAAAPGLVVPGHDALVFTRFPVAPPRVARID